MKPVHKKKTLRKLIRSGKVQIKRRALNNNLGWGRDEITDAILSLRQKDCHESKKKWHNPSVWYDYYRGYFLNEPFYTHFYIEDEILIIDSFKKRYEQ